MYLKLALRNIRRSVRDYAVYFITLLFGVAVFYAFNSIGSQQILFDMETSASRSVFDSTTYILGMFSVVVACVLGFLILYANQFLIRRRKREFGTYLVLGMTLFVLFPFSRLVHIWSAPVEYLTRKYQIVRARR